LENRSLVFDLVDWIAKSPRAYSVVMEAWRTSCPRLSIWEEATDRRFVERYVDEEGRPMVRATDHGRHFLQTETKRRAAA